MSTETVRETSKATTPIPTSSNLIVFIVRGHDRPM